MQKMNVGWNDSRTQGELVTQHIVSVVGVAVCVEQTGPALGDPEEGGGPPHGITISAGQSESHAELPQPARE